MSSLLRDHGRTLLTLSLITAVTSIVESQTKDSFITRFRGGAIGFELAASTTLLPAQEGSLISLNHIFSAPFEPLAQHLNPAFLAYATKPGVSIEFTPGFTLGLDRFIDLNGRSKQELDAAFEDFRSDDFVISYPNVRGDYLNVGGISSVTAMWPHASRGLGVFASFQNLLNLKSAHLNSGLETQVVSNVAVSDGVQQVNFNGFLDATSNAQLKARSFSLGAAWTLNPRTALSLTLNHYRSEVQGRLFANLDGVMIFGGREHIFNNPQDPWPNTLHQSASAGYRGSAFGLVLGGLYHLKQTRLVLDAVLELTPSVHMNGRVNQSFHKMPALDVGAVLDGNASDEILDPVKLKLTQLTLTEQDSFKTYDRLTLTLPARLKASLSFLGAGLKTRFTLGRYFRGLGMEFGPNSVALQPTFFANLQLELSRLQLSFGVTEGTLFTRGEDGVRNRELHLFIPLIAIGGNLDLTRNLKLYLILSSAPSPSLRSRLTFNF